MILKGNNMKSYTLSVSESQLKTISDALDVYSRLGIGQFRDAMDCLPTKEFRANGWTGSMYDIADILKTYTIDNVDGCHSHLGIMNPKVKECYRDAWDIHQVIRHRLSWDNLKQGDSAFGVSFDEPSKSSKQELPGIE